MKDTTERKACAACFHPCNRVFSPLIGDYLCLTLATVRNTQTGTAYKACYYLPRNRRGTGRFACGISDPGLIQFELGIARRTLAPVGNRPKGGKPFSNAEHVFPSSG